MRWDDMRESENVEDDRAASGGGGGGFGGGGLRLGVGGIALVAVVGLLMGKNPLEILGMVMQVSQNAPVQSTPHGAARPTGETDNDRSKSMVTHVLGDTEDTWSQLFKQAGRAYQPPKLVLFRQGIRSGCGDATSAVGPFYCPADTKVYLDLGFFDELRRRFGSPGDFAAAYVVAHEVGHHVQNLLGVSDKVSRARAGQSPRVANALSVKLELQADCLAGVWGHYAQQRGLLERGDLEQALTAAHAIGDDTLQRNAGRSVAPDAFTHGTSEQRMHWFRQGFDGGDIRQCDTFRAGADA
ncbi:KPN_02809 family neutral zinc metallopeptidase [Ralstonia solanacearum]|uniref:KPN_02809 family neutral zinc metallopeptidase n=1 Tax=Ralstonia solanacearum TaxID=305 RepID=UPI0002E66CCD|nr:neutral zinc metallopeptidase [Ralstonia solanacearum]AMP71003.1 flagellar biosynthesis protein FlgM [Ralstonia solanacearum]AMP73543.1 flagellar biosynthesis protein FlgM [Ralstonia solanacearum]AYB59921.1 flagellar biosynthesis protein FlgM [Ralstonia solanacearum]MBB6586719.1 zinc metallopeptidase [Ralstonia solanacearum]MCG3573289.1 zinc metallopeptidase [Ralstonia solanacearum]